MKRSDFIPYLAGLFDGEGTVGIYRQNTKESNNSFFLSVALGQKKSENSVKLLSMIENRFGGETYEWKNKSGSTMWKWQVTREHAIEFLEEVIPFLVIKKEQAKLSLKWQLTKRPLKAGPVPKQMRPAVAKWVTKTQQLSQKLKEMKRL